MPQDKIVIRFQPKGDRDLIKAIQSLALAQARLEKNTKKVKIDFFISIYYKITRYS